MVWKDPNVHWGPSSDQIRMTNVLKNHLDMREDSSHVKNYRPHILYLANNIEEDIGRVKLLSLIRKRAKSLFITSEVFVGDYHELSKHILQNPKDKLLVEKGVLNTFVYLC